MPLDTEVGLGPGDIVLDGDPAVPTERGIAAPHFSAHVYCGQTVAHLSNCYELLFACMCILLLYMFVNVLYLITVFILLTDMINR